MWSPKNRHICGDCGCQEGEFHYRGCDQEACPFCFRRLISCGCCYKQFYPGYDCNKPMCGLPKRVYQCGLSANQEKQWNRLLEKKGRIRWFLLPNMCARCGELWPGMFMAEDWNALIPADVRDKMLCHARATIWPKILSAQEIAASPNRRGIGNCP